MFCFYGNNEQLIWNVASFKYTTVYPGNFKWVQASPNAFRRLCGRKYIIKQGNFDYREDTCVFCADWPTSAFRSQSKRAYQIKHCSKAGISHIKPKTKKSDPNPLAPVLSTPAVVSPGVVVSSAFEHQLKLRLCRRVVSGVRPFVRPFVRS